MSEIKPTRTNRRCHRAIEAETRNSRHKKIPIVETKCNKPVDIKNSYQ